MHPLPPSPAPGRFSTLTALALLWLWLHNALFLTGWYQPWLAIPLSAALLAAVLYYSFALPMSEGQHAAKGHLLSIIISVVLLTAYLIIGGLIGYFPTPVDSFVFRQALYENFYSAPWPLILPNGKEMTYYIAGVLPTAMMARMMPDFLKQLPVLLCTLIPLIMALLLLGSTGEKKKRGIPLLFLLLMLAFQDPLCALFSDAADQGTGGVLTAILNRLNETFHINLNILKSYYGNQTMTAPIYTCIWAYNSAPSTLLAAAILCTEKHQRGILPLTIALLFPISPLGALAALPIAVWFYLKSFPSIRTLILPCILPLITVAAYMAYFLRADSNYNVIDLDWNVHGSKFWIFYIRYLAGLMLVALPLWKTRRNDPFYLFILLCSLLRPFLFVGSLPSATQEGLNEFSLKGGIVYTAIFALWWYQDWKEISSPFRWCLCLFLLASPCVFLAKQLYRFDISHRVADMWNGHLNHDRHFLKQSIPGIKNTPADFIFLKESGAAERVFPGKLLPKAQGCDYTRQPIPGAFR